MGEKKIAICLERLDIGGVETAVLNQAMALKDLGHQVVILARDGIYTKVLQEKGIKCVDISFDLGNNLDLKKAQQIVKVLKENEIEEVHINQYPCILSVFPACILANIPYVAYSHVNISGVYEWFENTFDLYEDLFAYYFKQASKIVAITQEAKDEIITRYKIAEDKFVIRNNSMYFKEMKQETEPVQTIKNFLIVSRLSREKETSIKNGIDLFLAYAKNHVETKLTIIGEGDLRKCLEEYIGENQAIEMIGAKNNVLEYMEKNDVVIGLDRCILEAIAMKRIALLSGYTKLRGIITKQNIEEATKKNFSGRNLESVSKDELVKQLEELTKDQIEQIAQENYQFAYHNLNSKNNIYILEEPIKTNEEDCLELLVKLQEKRSQLKEEKQQAVKQLEEDKQKQNERLKQKEKELEEDKKLLQQKEEKVQALEQELKEVYASKRWRVTDKISKIFS